MVWSKVQQQNNADRFTPTTITATYDSTPTEDNLLIAVFGYKDTNEPETPPSGWTLAKLQVGASQSISIWSKIAGASEATAVTFSWTGGARCNLLIVEYSGNITTSPFDVAAGVNGGTPVKTTISSGTTATTAEDDEMWIAGFTLIDGGTPFISFTNSFTEIYDNDGGSDDNTQSMGVAHRLEADIAAAETTATWTGGRRVCSVIATFKPAAGAAAGSLIYNPNPMKALIGR